MPSFAKKEHDVTEEVGDAFAGEQVQNVLKNMKDEARKRAIHIIQRDIPEYIAHLNGLIEASKTDESSPLWRGQLKHGAYVKENVKLAYQQSSEDDARNIQPQGTPPIVIRDVDELSLTNVAVRDERLNSVVHGLEQPGIQWKGRLASNEVCNRLMDLLEQESERAATMGKELVHWVRLQIPQIEDGNTFGVEVQAEMVSQIERVINGAMKVHKQPKVHYEDRMHLAQSWNKFPGLEDHAAAIASSDRFDYFLGVMAITALRNSMTELLSHLCNNWAKVHNPKNADSAGAMY